MFFTRTRILIILLLLGIAGVLVRAAQIQWWQHDQWAAQANRGAVRDELVETSRGRILDVKGRELAIDAPCMDAVIDYRIITLPPDEKWIKDYARVRMRRRLGDTLNQVPAPQRPALLQQQIQQIRADIEQMWQVLGDEQLTGTTHVQIEDRRNQIIQRVQMRRRSVWYQHYLKAEKKSRKKDDLAWWQRWIADDKADAPELDTFDVTVSEQEASHILLPSISEDLANYLSKNADRFPGLSIRPGQHRVYPYKDSACHVVGYLTQVSGDDLLKGDGKADDLRLYLKRDLIGRHGAEALCETALRGTRGLIRSDRSTGQVTQSVAPQSGSDVRLTIDIELQKKIEQAFVQRKPIRADDYTGELHGAAVVIDVATNQVRALVSYPTYDVNDLDKTYAQLARDYLNRPLLTRATMSQLEPGSIVKPMVGIAGITEKVVGVNEGIECTGYLVLNGHRYSVGRCWTVARARPSGTSPAHHAFAPYAHQGHDGNPDGFLTFSDALMRSCNVYCETVADRLGVERLNKWYGLFGLGRPTGIGLAEKSGRLPMADVGPVDQRRARLWFAGIGQGDVAATPIQMANVAATIARDGLWMRPNLVTQGMERITTPSSLPDRVMLPVDKAAMQAAKLGMYEVVNAPGGTGGQLKFNRADVLVCGKTGTAQAHALSIPVFDDNGKITEYQHPEFSTKTFTNPDAPWYRNTGESNRDLSHAWFIGFAPAQNPRIAFAVLVEYGGGGGAVAGPVAQALLEAADQEGYLAPTSATAGR